MAAALRRSLNKAKQVAPEPDIPVTLRLRDLGQSLKHGGDRRRYPDRGRFQIVAAQREKIQKRQLCQIPLQGTIERVTPTFDPGARPSAAKTFGVGA